MPDNLNHLQQLEAMVGVNVASSAISFLLKTQEYTILNKAVPYDMKWEK